MDLTIIGCFGPYPKAGGCCSGYLVRHENTAVLIDCGNGVLGRLRYYLEPWELDAVIVSHLHADHYADLLVMRYALLVRGTAKGSNPLPVYAPPSPEAEFGMLSYKDIMITQAVNAGATVEVGSLTVSFAAGVHAVTSHLVTVEGNGKKIVYSGDTEDFPGLAKAAMGADLFLCEAGYLRSDVEAGRPNHLAAFQAAQAAVKAGVKKLVLTHHHPERNIQETIGEAQEIFPDCEPAVPGNLYKLG